MPDIHIQQMPTFKRVYKKLHPSIRAHVNNAIKDVVNNPTIGHEKKGDLRGIFVYKFKVNQQEFLLAYEWDEANRLLLALGVHENFYRDSKQK